MGRQARPFQSLRLINHKTTTMEFNTKTITLKIDACEFKDETEKKARAFSLLVEGEYNRIGRHIPFEEYEKLQKEFENLIYEMKKLDSKYPQDKPLS